jgi:hypothetical protein
MGKQYTTAEHLSVLSDEQLNALEQELLRQHPKESGAANTQPDGVKRLIGKGIIRGAAAFGEGALLGFQGRPLSEGTFTGTPASDKYTELLKQEQLKNAIDPSKRLSQMELDKIIRDKAQGTADQAGVVTPEAQGKSVTDQLGPEPPDFVIIKKPNKYGTYDEETIKNPKKEEWLKGKDRLLSAEQSKQTEQNKAQIESQKTAVESTVDLNKFAGAAQGLSQAYADMIGQGAGGSRVNLMTGRAKSWIVGEQASNLRRVDAAHRDLVLMMAPILSKSGRVLNSVLKMLGETYPSGTESAYTAKNMIQQDVLNMYRITKATNSIDPKIFDGLSTDQADGIAMKIISMANSYQFSPEEEKAINSKMSDITAPLEKFISPEKQGSTILNTPSTNNPNAKKIGRFVVEVQ